MKMKRDIIVTLQNGKIVGSEVSLKIVHDSNYGADADGNRGIPTTFIEDVYFATPKFTLDGELLDVQEMEEAELLIESKIDDTNWYNDNE